jgi:hypothetical protein
MSASTITPSPTDGIDVCVCGAKYWDGSFCHSCGDKFVVISEISDHDWDFANSFPDAVGYIAYLEARQNGSSHIWAANLAWKAIAR